MEIQRMPETGQVQKPEISSGTGKPKISQRNFGKDRRNFSGSDRSSIWIDFRYFLIITLIGSVITAFDVVSGLIIGIFELLLYLLQ